MSEEQLTSLSYTVKQLILDGAEARKMENEYMVALSYASNPFSYAVAHLAIPFVSSDDLLKHLLLGQNVVDSLRLY